MSSHNDFYNNHKVSFVKSLAFKVILGLITFDLFILFSISFIMNSVGTDLVLAESNKVVEEVGNNLIEGLNVKLGQAEALGRSLANIGEVLTRDRKSALLILKNKKFPVHL